MRPNHPQPGGYMFYRINDEGNAQIFEDNGEVVRRIDANVYPIGSDLSARYEHPNGIVLSVADAEKIGINFEDNKNLYDVEWIENDVNRQKTGLSDFESNDLLCELADRGIIGTKTAR
jgi:hypothetical protein